VSDTGGIPAAIPNLIPITNISSNKKSSNAETVAAAAQNLFLEKNLKVSKTDTRLAALVGDGATPATFAAALAVPGAAEKGWPYVAAIVGNMLRAPATPGAVSGQASESFRMLPRADTEWTKRNKH
jgi:hypothetical protein